MPRRTQDPARVFGNFAYRACTFCGRAFNPVRLFPPFPRRGPTTPAQSRFGLLRFRSPLLSESLLFSSPPGTKMFQFPGLSSRILLIQIRMTRLFNLAGFPHSDTPGSLSVYDSPRRFAVNCVLLLLYMPRHPPYALFHLICLENYFFLDLVFLNLTFATFSERPICLSSVIQFSKNFLL